MDVVAWDAAFVRAARPDVYPLLADVAGYQAWWPGVRTERRGDEFDVALTTPGVLRLRPQLLRLRLAAQRPDRGLRFTLAGQWVGDVEWFCLDERAGVVVHWLARASVADRGAGAMLRAHRAAVRLGLHALKDRLEAGRRPGAEPDPRLLAHQARVRGTGTARA
jgi:hypothetical protein